MGGIPKEVVDVIKRTYPEARGNHFNVAVAGTPERMSKKPERIAQVLLKALLANTGIVYVGFDEFVSSSNGYELDAGDPVSIPIDDLSKVWLDVSVDGEGVSYILVR